MTRTKLVKSKLKDLPILCLAPSWTPNLGIPKHRQNIPLNIVPEIKSFHLIIPLVTLDTDYQFQGQGTMPVLLNHLMSKYLTETKLHKIALHARETRREHTRKAENESVRTLHCSRETS